MSSSNVNLKKVDKWVLLSCTVVVEYVIVMDVLDLNSMINHCIQKIILNEEGMSA